MKAPEYYEYAVSNNVTGVFTPTHCHSYIRIYATVLEDVVEIMSSKSLHAQQCLVGHRGLPPATWYIRWLTWGIPAIRFHSRSVQPRVLLGWWWWPAACSSSSSNSYSLSSHSKWWAARFELGNHSPPVAQGYLQRMAALTFMVFILRQIWWKSQWSTEASTLPSF